MALSAQDGQPRPTPALSTRASASVRLPSPTTTAAAIIILPNTHPVLIVSWALGPAPTLIIPPESPKRPPETGAIFILILQVRKQIQRG